MQTLRNNYPLRTAVVAITSLAISVLPACGGGGNDGASSTPSATSPAVTPNQIRVTKLAASGPSQASVIVSESNGDHIAYFLNPSSGQPVQALVHSGDQQANVYYDADGGIQRIVDQATGSFVVVKPRLDKLGNDYLNFDSAGTYLGGRSLFQKDGIWYTAEVLGEMGQLTSQLSVPANGGVAALSGAMALRAAQLSYGAAQALPAGAQAILNGQVQTAHIGSRLLDMFVSSAQAQSFTAQDRTRLMSGIAISIAGGVVLAGASTVAVSAFGALLLVGGASKTYQALSGIQATNFDTASNAMDQILEQSVSSGPIDSETRSTSMLDRLRNRIRTAIDQGLDRIKTLNPRTVDNTSPFDGVNVGEATPNTSPATITLPRRPLLDAQLSGSVVDQTGRVFGATGAVDAQGALQVNAQSQDGQTLNVNATVAIANGQVDGTVNGTVSRTVNGVTTNGTMSGQTAGLGKCEELQQSGGQGTFSYAINLGQDAGAFSLYYQMYSIPDGMTIVVGAQTVFTTNGLVSGSKTTTVQYSGGDTAFVNMYAPNSGTAWDFNVGCPSK